MSLAVGFYKAVGVRVEDAVVGVAAKLSLIQYVVAMFLRKSY